MSLDALPHGPEFRFLDRLILLTPGQSATAEFVIRPDLPFLAGHFPGNPLFPGVLLVEAGAQLAGVVAQSDPHQNALQDLRLSAIRSIKIYDTGTPNDTLSVEARLLGRLEGLVQAEIRVWRKSDQRLLLEGQVILAGRVDRGGSAEKDPFKDGKLR